MLGRTLRVAARVGARVAQAQIYAGLGKNKADRFINALEVFLILYAREFFWDTASLRTREFQIGRGSTWGSVMVCGYCAYDMVFVKMNTMVFEK